VAEVLLFHHVLGRTRGMMGLRDQLQVGGNRVYVPDLFEGHVFTDRREGRAYVQQIGVDTILERARRAAEKLPRQLVFAGVSMGALAAYELTRSREGAVAALIISAAFEPVDLQSWPEAVPAQIHVMEDDPLLTPGDTAAMRTVAASKSGIQLFSYPGHTPVH
jgi:pimeloyl-ACP methyl ester carboxylesterase